MDEMEKDYLVQLETLEDENEKLKSSVCEGNDLLVQCQRALTQASLKSTTLSVSSIYVPYFSLTILMIFLGSTRTIKSTSAAY